MDNSGYLTVKDIEAKYGITKRKLYWRINNGSLSFVEINGVKMISEDELKMAFMDKVQSNDTVDYNNEEFIINADIGNEEIDLNNIDIKNAKELNKGTIFISKQALYLKKMIELDELRGIRDKPNILNRREEELKQREQRLTELEIRNKETQLRLNNELASLDLKIEELNQRYKNLEEKEAKAEAVENELKKRVIEFSNKVKKDMEVIKSKQLELDTKERDNNYSRQCLIEDIAKFNAMVDWYYRRTGIKFTR